MSLSDVSRFSFVAFVVLVVQHALLDVVSVAGAHPDAVMLIPIAAGYVAGPQRGAIAGFATGLVADLLLPTTFGLSALVGCLLGYGTALSTRSLVRGSWWLPPAVFAVAAGAGLVAYAMLAAILGDSGALRYDLAPALVVDVPSAAVLATPVLRMVAWSLPPPEATSTGRRGQVLR